MGFVVLIILDCILIPHVYICIERDICFLVSNKVFVLVIGIYTKADNTTASV